MLGTIRKWWLATLILFLSVQTSRAQTSAAPSFPDMTGSTFAPGITGSRHGLGSSLEDGNGSALVGDKYLDGPRDNLGWFASVDLDLLGAHVNNELVAPVTAGLHTNNVRLASADLNWTVSPRFEVGYRLGQGAGELLVSYRFLSTDGTATTPAFDALGNAGSLRSRLDMHVVDLDYANQENSLLPWAEMKWRVGVRITSLFFDSEETAPALQQHVSNHFVGAGPHAALELWKPIMDRQVGLFFKIDAAGVLGSVMQTFEETIPDAAGLSTSGITRQSQYMPTVMLNVQAGVSWTPRDNWRISCGYTYEHWWDATYDGNSRGDVMTQGVFFRAEWKY